MSIVVYKCSVCDRELEVVANHSGLDVINNCIITSGCRGTLFKSKELSDYTRGKLSKPVAGLEDWVKRSILYTHNQSRESNTWRINHNLNGNPIVIVYVSRPTEDNPDNLVEVVPKSISFIDKNNTTITFDTKYSGIAQFIVQLGETFVLTTSSPSIQTTASVSNSGELTLAIARSRDTHNFLNMHLEITYPNSQKMTKTLVLDSVASIYSPWRSFDSVWIDGINYDIRSFNIRTLGLTTGSSFVISAITPGFPSPKKREILFLLSSEPHQIFDIISDRYLDSQYLLSPLTFNGSEITYMISDEIGVSRLIPSQ